MDNVVSCSKRGVYMTTISAKIADSDKTLFETICDSIGLNVSSAINAFVKATIREKGMPFQLKAMDDPYIYSGEASIYDSYTAYGALIEGNAVCQGYTEAMALFLDRLNVTNYRIRSGSHAWNALYLDDHWYHLDVTWDDPVMEDGSNYLQYTYYLVDNDTLFHQDSSGIHEFDTSIYQEFI